MTTRPPSAAPDAPRIIVGMSGGVDSSVAALLLVRAGYRVEAMHMTNWDADDEYCTAAADLQDAREVCEALGIPLHHVNFAAEYRARVFQHFLDAYAAGRTPNPDVLCNREIKFGSFLACATRLGADLIATGHYARVAPTGEGTATLLKAADRSKDQSYFLHAVGAAALAKTRFPLGGLQKREVRRIAMDAGLPTHRKKDSTGICFIGERPFREFLQRYLPAQPGDIVDDLGRHVGRHSGLMHYTPGQRQGLGIGGRSDGGGEPWYVAGKDLPSNTLLVVQGKQHPALYYREIECANVHWIGGTPAALARGGGIDCTAKVRYRQADQRCAVTATGDGTLRVVFDAPQWAVAAGQYAVFYDGERCLGGGEISAALHEARGDALLAG